MARPCFIDGLGQACGSAGPPLGTGTGRVVQRFQLEGAPQSLEQDRSV